MDAKSKALAVIQREQLLSKGDSVVVGVSGGADSVALLHTLLSLKDELLLAEVVAVHVNHGLRGEEAERDSRFVTDICCKWGVQLFTFTSDVSALTKEQKIGVEEAGRDVRYRLLNQVADSLGNAVIATAHTASDNAETVLLHLCRGSGIQGMSGIPVKRGNIIRPFIDCTRAEIELYCAENQLDFVTDSTNADATFSRNRIRLQVMPKLHAINSQADAAICRFSNQAREVYAFMEELAKKAEEKAFIGENTYSRETLLSLPKPVRDFTLRRLLGQVEEKHLKLAQTALVDGGTVSISNDKRLAVSGNTVTVIYVKEAVLPFSYAVVCGEPYKVGDTSYRVNCYSYAEYEQKLKNDKNIFKNAFDYDTIDGTLTLRQRLAGDTFHPVGRGCGKTLKKLFNEQKTKARDSIPLLCDETGIVLVFGFGCDERVRITPSTVTVAVLEEQEVKK